MITATEPLIVPTTIAPTTIAESSPLMATPAKPSALARAVEWLRERLSGGPLPTKIVISEALASGHAVRTLRRAAKHLGIIAEHLGAPGSQQRWTWRLATLDELDPKAAKNERATPQDVFESLEEEFGPFALDVCASDWNAKCRVYYTRTDDGLAQPWRSPAWMNPPYSNQGPWFAKAAAESDRGVLVVGLVMVATSTRYWHEQILPRVSDGRCEVRFWPRRIRFVGAKGSPEFDNAVVIWRPSAIPDAPGDGAPARGSDA